MSVGVTSGLGRPVASCTHAGRRPGRPVVRPVHAKPRAAPHRGPADRGPLRPVAARCCRLRRHRGPGPVTRGPPRVPGGIGPYAPGGTVGRRGRNARSRRTKTARRTYRCDRVAECSTRS